MAEKKSKQSTKKAEAGKEAVPKKPKLKAKTVDKEATPEKARSARKRPGKMVKGDAQYPIYDASNSRDAYKVGEVIKFEKVRDWMAKGELVEAYGKVVGVGVFDKTIPYLEVSFSDVKKLNSRDLGADIRKFILEQK
ncbi:MAG: hypothetical protein A2Y63_01730 [Candidatus Riflebacteria bacterium RBG_13_59_9]|nr:MAG: hypothetical protein A2Y63_01730 [Candidatus Riflebacteria bacterium RBG_13_59_9]